MSTHKASPELLAHEQLLRNAPALLEAAKAASEALHQFHPQQYRIPVGRGICTFGPCKQLFDAITKATSPQAR